MQRIFDIGGGIKIKKVQKMDEMELFMSHKALKLAYIYTIVFL